MSDTSFTPARVTARGGVATRVVLRTAGVRGCTREIVIPSLGLR